MKLRNLFPKKFNFKDLFPKKFQPTIKKPTIKSDGRAELIEGFKNSKMPSKFEVPKPKNSNNQNPNQQQGNQKIGGNQNGVV